MKFKIICSPNYKRRQRRRNSIKFVVLHYTGMQSERVSIKKLISNKSKVSTHYLINRKGTVVKMIDEKKIAFENLSFLDLLSLFFSEYYTRNQCPS